LRADSGDIQQSDNEQSILEPAEIIMLEFHFLSAIKAGSLWCCTAPLVYSHGISLTTSITLKVLLASLLNIRGGA